MHFLILDIRMFKYNISPNIFINLLHLLTTLLLFILIFAAFKFSYNIIFNKGSQLNTNVPIYVNPYKTSLLMDRFKEGSLSRFNKWPFPNNELNISKGSLKVDYKIQNNTYKSVTILHLFMLISIGFGLVFMIRKILGSVKNEKPFSYQNVKYLHMISLFFVLKYLTQLAHTSYMHWYIKNFIPLVEGSYISQIFMWTEPHKYSVMSKEVLLGNSQTFSTLIFAFLIFAVAQVFKEGVRLKQDNESIL